jgi:hypothetical protein
VHLGHMPWALTNEEEEEETLELPKLYNFSLSCVFELQSFCLNGELF